MMPMRDIIRMLAMMDGIQDKTIRPMIETEE